MENKELSDLIEKYQMQTCTAEEAERLNEWYDSYEEYVDDMPPVRSQKFDRIWGQISSQIEQENRRRRLFIGRRAAAVAVIVLAFAATISYFFADESLNEPMVAQQEIILPAEGVATLELSSGQKISLDDMLPDATVSGVNAENRSAEKVLDYSSAHTQETPAKDTPAEIQYNTIHVPAGNEYKVVLADGSQVHLNSCSSLRYPVQFSGDQRVVQMEGEAYFDVSKSDKPFIVKTAVGFDVRVFGTSFNVNAYAEGSELSTALVSGKVRVVDHVHGQEYDMEPGYALTYQRINGEVEMQEADMDNYISWTTGRFIFNDMSLEDIFLKMERWYGVDIKYDNDFLKHRRMTGVLRKDKPLNELLEIFQKITKLKFTIEDKVVTISK